MKPRGGLIRWSGPSSSGKYAPSRVDGAQIRQIEKFIGGSLAGFLDGHPCIGARTLASDRSFFYAVYPDMHSVSTAIQLLDDIEQYYIISDQGDDIVKSLICIFTVPISSAEDFSKKFWEFNQLVHDVDSLTHAYDDTVSSNPNDSQFELSFRGRAAFPTTIHPQHPRPARCFAYAGWALNQSSQFSELRKQGKFEAWQKKIRTADASVDPSSAPNPLLADHGDASAAAQLGQIALDNYPFTARSIEDRTMVLENLMARAIREGEVQEVITRLEKISNGSS